MTVPRWSGPRASRYNGAHARDEGSGRSRWLVTMSSGLVRHSEKASDSCWARDDPTVSYFIFRGYITNCNGMPVRERSAREIQGPRGVAL